MEFVGSNGEQESRGFWGRKWKQSCEADRKEEGSEGRHCSELKESYFDEVRALVNYVGRGDRGNGGNNFIVHLEFLPANTLNLELSIFIHLEPFHREKR
ncbi:hypothetical protein CRG98_008332 [Punica granatum]|uniref:Uncharacterized protein n=1 Tax=Punica granatum TaxID=22663 RepID=A0A2I0KS74_PUNGR|nr:hypothetical protein CRG98_008332 [Punica granatum]